MNFIFLLLLLPVLAVAQVTPTTTARQENPKWYDAKEYLEIYKRRQEFDAMLVSLEKKIENKRVAVMSRQQATMPAIPTEWSVEGKIFALQARLDSLEAKLSRVHIDSVMVAGEWSFTPRRVDQYWIPPHWKQIISFDPEGE